VGQPKHLEIFFRFGNFGIISYFDFHIISQVMSMKVRMYYPIPNVFEFGFVKIFSLK